ncbi:LUD domain-containing protein [Vulcanisaeta thermophila]|uniref:LUD domain-containing protein n=1 Tax=Vulcanisaeta thermophila TaxID=867917 RepID=UPI000852BF4F|nr:lactate utilization protein B [Vulcanisaeta thermophila]
MSLNPPSGWETAIERAKSSNIPSVYRILEQYPYIKDLARELRKAKEEVIKNLDHYIEMTRKSVERIGGRFYLANTPQEAREIVGKIVGSGKVIVMSKNNVATETGLRPYLQELGNEVWETDLGEFLVQIANEEPSHILAPALHMTKERIAQVMKEKLGINVQPDPVAIAQVAREFLRDKFMKAQVGITGANAIAADTGAVLLVENEGNIRMTTVVPPVHIVYDGVEKIVPTLYHAVMETLVQAAYAGHYPPTYVNLTAGPSSTGDVEMFRVSPAQGPREFHMVLIDNGRRRAARDPVLWEALLCIRCGRCSMHCPTYWAVGPLFGKPPYTGPMGIPWTAVTRGIEVAGPAAMLCTHSGNCREVCPMNINLPLLIQHIKGEYMKSITK